MGSIDWEGGGKFEINPCETRVDEDFPLVIFAGS